jgi:hypothetical protein
MFTRHFQIDPNAKDSKSAHCSEVVASSRESDQMGLGELFKVMLPSVPSNDGKITKSPAYRQAPIIK